MSEWRETTLGSVCELKRGYDLPASSRLPGDTPIVSSSGITGYHSVAKVRAPGVVTGRYGTLGEVFFIEEDFWPLNTALYVRDFKGNDPRFVAALLQSLELGKNDGAAAVPGVNRNQLHTLPVLCPDPDTQRGIGLVFGILDNLIDNNHRRIDLLGQMAQTIYREWFVNFRYPGYEDATFIDSPFGLVPRDWEIKTLADVIDVDKGLSYKGAYLTETGVPMANLKCFRPGGGFRRDGTKPYSGPFKPKHEVFPGDLIVANTDLTQAGAVIGSPALVPRRGFESGGIISHHLFAIRCAERELLPWLYEVFHDDRFRSYARGVASGTTVLGFRPADLLSYQIACPPEPMWKAFGNLAGNFFRNAENLSEASDHLVDIRGLLLPRLVTGKIDVSSLDLDSVVESVA